METVLMVKYLVLFCLGLYRWDAVSGTDSQLEA